MIPNIVGKKAETYEPGSRPIFGQIRKNTGETDATTNADAAVANAAAYTSAADTNVMLMLMMMMLTMLPLLMHT